MQHININNVIWSVCFCNPLSNDLKRSDGTITLGVTDCNTHSVYLSSALKGELLYKVLCHELCHCYIFSYGWYLDIEEEEHLAQFISEYGKALVGDTDSLLQLLIGKHVPMTTWP